MSEKRKIVIKVTGNIFDSPEDLFFKDFIKLVVNLHKDHNIIIITGGGKNARNYIKLARNFRVNEATLDEIGIFVSRINAKLLISCLGTVAYKFIPESLNEVEHGYDSGKVVVCGGMNPGQSTNAVATLIAEKIGAELLINASEIDGVYTSDPKINKNAKKLDKVTVNQLHKILEDNTSAAGTYELLDPVALKIIQRSKIPVVLGKCSVEFIRDVVKGKSVGTKVMSNSEK